MLSKRLQTLARSIDRARWKRRDDERYQLGISYVAHAIADDSCTGEERHHFLLASGTPFDLGSKL